MTTRRGCRHTRGHDTTAPYRSLRCPYGNCTIDVCAVDAMILGSSGPVGCPCDLLPGWRALFVDQMSKPHPPVKATGRHAGRVRRSQTRHDLSDWYRTLEGLAKKWTEEPIELSVDVHELELQRQLTGRAPEPIYASVAAEHGHPTGAR